MYPPIALEQLVAQHVSDLHADAAEHRLIRECRRAHAHRRAATPGRRASPTILRLCRAIARQVRRTLRPDLPAVLHAGQGPADAVHDVNNLAENWPATTRGRRETGDLKVTTPSVPISAGRSMPPSQTES
jgi:hypothetical protein